MNDHDREVLENITDDIDLTELIEVTKDIRELSIPIDWKALRAAQRCPAPMPDSFWKDMFEGPQCPDDGPEIENYADRRGV